MTTTRFGLLLICSILQMAQRLDVSFAFSNLATLSTHSATKNRQTSRYSAASEDTADSSSNLPTVAVVGTGAVGGLYGARLWEAGLHNVKFQMRGENYQKSIQDGFQVTSVHGDIFIPPDKLQAYETTDEIGPVDWVVVALKSTALEAIPELIFPLLKKDTRVLVVMNGLVEDDLIHALKVRAGEKEYESYNEFLDENDDSIQFCAAVYGGMALVCSNRLTPGHVDHSYAGLLNAGVASFNPDRTTVEQNQAAFEALFKGTKVDIAFEKSLLRGRWKKNVWNLPFNGISVAMGGITVDKIVGDPGLRWLADTVMDETIAVANADLLRHHEDDSFYLGNAEKKQMMDLSDGMGPYRTSTMIDLTEKRPLEVKYLFRKAIERAKILGIPVPHLETLVVQIEAFQRFDKLF